MRTVHLIDTPFLDFRALNAYSTEAEQAAGILQNITDIPGVQC